MTDNRATNKKRLEDELLRRGVDPGSANMLSHSITNPGREQGTGRSIVVAIEQVKDARENITLAEKELMSVGKTAIEDAVRMLLDSGSDNVVWAQRSNPYNDEGMYDGVHGPIVGVAIDEGEGVWNNDAIREMIYSGSVSSRGQSLRELLEAIGETILSEIFEDESVVIAEKGPSYDTTGEIKYTVEYAGY